MSKLSYIAAISLLVGCGAAADPVGPSAVTKDTTANAVQRTEYTVDGEIFNPCNGELISITKHVVQFVAPSVTKYAIDFTGTGDVTGYAYVGSITVQNTYSANKVHQKETIEIDTDAPGLSYLLDSDWIGNDDQSKTIHYSAVCK